MGHVRQKDIDHARDGLKKLELLKLEAQHLEQARTAFEERLRTAACTKSPEKLHAAIKDAESDANSEARSLPMGDRAAAISAARAELQIQMLKRLCDLSDAEDMEALNRALDDAEGKGVAQADIDNFTDRLRSLQLRHHHRNELSSALKHGEKAKLITVVAEAQRAGLDKDEHMLKAKAAIQEVEAREKVAAEKAAALRKAEDDRAAAAEQIRFALCTDDADSLASALAFADTAGLDGAEVAPARERLRVLRVMAGASIELEAAIESGEVYKLRAAISTVRGTGVDQKQLERAKATLSNLTAKTDAHRSLASALGSGDAGIIAHAIAEAKRRGVAKADIAQAEAGLHTVKHTSVGGELQAAMEAGEISRLRMAVGAAADAGMAGQQLDAAWERIRFLESQEWSIRELRAARESGVSARLQVAISHAEQASVCREQLSAARADLRAWLSKSQAQQELQLARASGSACVLRAALDAARAAGIKDGTVSAAQAELTALERGGNWRPPPPSIPPPPPVDDDEGSSMEDDEVDPDSPPTAPKLHNPPKLNNLQVSKMVTWGPHCGVQMLPQSQPASDVSIDFDGAGPPSCLSSGPPTDPQFHDIPGPPRSW